MSEGCSEIPLLLFAKAPVAGSVKTRLTDQCSTQQAAEIAEILIEESLKVTTAYWPGKVYLSVWQFNDHPYITKMLERYNVELLSQARGDLGQKMLSAFNKVGYPAIIMGCDAPLVAAETLVEAYESLSNGDNVIGPSQDGGYYLIGLSQPAPQLFNGVDWGSETVLSKTLSLSQHTDLQLTKLAESYDIDRWADVIKASKKIPALEDYLYLQKLL